MPTDDVLAVVGRADDLYFRRAEPGAVRESVMVLSGAHGGADRYEVQWRLARALFFLGQEAGSRDSARQLYAAGIGAGERAVALNQERVEGHFWLGVNFALFAEVIRGIRGIRGLRSARLELKRAIEIDERYHGAGPLRVLGRLEHKSPKILGGSRKRSRELFERALAISPCNSVSLLYAAELAISDGESDRASTLLELLLECSCDSEWAFEHNRDRKRAGLLLEELRRALRNDLHG
ncbi:MAG TPA: TRAP transporter TatT component family protein [Blastocatellia bacterium]|nr:TRAP transporter TatT component family protein [Blastocatellia bacterium]